MTPRPRRAPAPARPPLTEADFQSRVIDLARRCGWLVMHALPAWSNDGARVRTATQGDRGFPDLVLARDGALLIVELKRDDTHPDPWQRAWHAHLGQHVVVWRPRDWPAVQAALTARRTNPLPPPPPPPPKKPRGTRPVGPTTTTHTAPRVVDLDAVGAAPEVPR